MHMCANPSFIIRTALNILYTLLFVGLHTKKECFMSHAKSILNIVAIYYAFLLLYILQMFIDFF